MASIHVPAYEDRFVQLRTIAAIGARYLVMAATSYGVSAFQALPPATSPLDPWWLASIPLGALLAWRVLGTLRRREEEAAYWIHRLQNEYALNYINRLWGRCRQEAWPREVRL